MILFFYNYYAPFYRKITIKMYLQENNMIQQNEYFAIKKCYFGFIIKEIKEFWMADFFVILFLNDKKLLSHMDQIREHINSTNHKFNFMIKLAELLLTLVVRKVTTTTTPLPNYTGYRIYY